MSNKENSNQKVEAKKVIESDENSPNDPASSSTSDINPKFQNAKDSIHLSKERIPSMILESQKMKDSYKDSLVLMKQKSSFHSKKSSTLEEIFKSSDSEKSTSLNKSKSSERDLYQDEIVEDQKEEEKVTKHQEDQVSDLQINKKFENSLKDCIRLAKSKNEKHSNLHSQNIKEDDPDELEVEIPHVGGFRDAKDSMNNIIQDYDAESPTTFVNVKDTFFGLENLHATRRRSRTKEHPLPAEYRTPRDTVYDMKDERAILRSNSRQNFLSSRKCSDFDPEDIAQVNQNEPERSCCDCWGCCALNVVEENREPPSWQEIIETRRTEVGFRNSISQRVFRENNLNVRRIQRQGMTALGQRPGPSILKKSLEQPIKTKSSGSQNTNSPF